MSITTAVHDYINSILNRTEGMKILLVDTETVGILSMVLSQSQILEKEVFLVEVIDRSSSEPSDGGHNMKHLKAVSFLRPTAGNFVSLSRELKAPRFSEYHLLPHNRLEQLAGSDDLDLVRQVQEVYADVLAINSDLFSLNIPSTVSLTAQQSLWTSYEDSILGRIVDGLFGTALALRMHPMVRYSRASPLCYKVAQLVQSKIDEEHILFEQLNITNQSVILITDRREDPITPLLNQWTYQAMCHELIGLEKNRMDLRKSPGVKKEFEEVVLSCSQDKFFDDNLISNFGDLAVNIEHYLSKYQEQTKNNKKIETIDDMQKFIDQYPEFKKLSGNVSKHVTIVHELSRLVSVGNLINVSALEQEIACEEGKQEQLRKILIALSDPNTHQLEKLRLVLIYSVKYRQDQSGINQLRSALSQLGISDEQIGLVDLLLLYTQDFFKPEEIAKKNVLSMIRNAAGFGGIENVYTQHKSVLYSTIEALIKGRLKEATHPFIESRRRNTAGREKPGDVIAFTIGGTTYEEGRDVRTLNVSNPSNRIILGGTNLLSSKTFLADVAQLKRTRVSGIGKD